MGMGMQHKYTAWKSSKVMQHGYGHAARIYSMEKQQGHAALT
jgi:hypothetical protein